MGKAEEPVSQMFEYPTHRSDSRLIPEFVKPFSKVRQKTVCYRIICRSVETMYVRDII